MAKLLETLCAYSNNTASKWVSSQWDRGRLGIHSDINLIYSYPIYGKNTFINKSIICLDHIEPFKENKKFIFADKSIFPEETLDAWAMARRRGHFCLSAPAGFITPKEVV